MKVIQKWKPEKNPVLVSKTETKWQNFSLSSRSLRLGGKILVLVSKHEIKRKNSRARLEARDWKKENLDLVSKRETGRKKFSIPSRTRDWKTDILDPVSKVETGLSLDTGVAKTSAMVNFQCYEMSMVHFSTAMRYRFVLGGLTSSLLRLFFLTIGNDYFLLFWSFWGPIILRLFTICPPFQ